MILYVDIFTVIFDWPYCHLVIISFKSWGESLSIIFLSKALSQMVHLWSYRFTMPPRACVRLVHETVGCPNHNFSIQKCSRAPPSQPLYAPDPHFCWVSTGANSSADFYSTVKAALRHERADSEEDHEGLECDLVQSLTNTRLYSHLCLKLIVELCG